MSSDGSYSSGAGRSDEKLNLAPLCSALRIFAPFWTRNFHQNALALSIVSTR